MNSSVGKILKQGENCWKAGKANRAAVLIDGESCFRAMREAMINARRDIFIIGWDVHSELRMVRDEEPDGYPETLGDLLAFLIKKHPQLNVYILDWDFVMVYAMEREMFPHYKLMWKAYERLYFELDAEHPIGGSQHQKIVVIDDEIAFSGGLDLSHCRWDTHEHRVDDSRRIGPDGSRYPPFHDVQMIVDGEAAAALGSLARQRWQRAGKSFNQSGQLVPGRSENDKWPASVKPLFKNVELGIARTFPAYKEHAAVREVEKLYLDSIAAAQNFIYIENQYFTAHSVGEALAEKLKQEKGPEVIVVLPQSSNGWLEHYVMDVLRFRLLEKLKEADQYGRLRAFYVGLDAEKQVSLMVHAKVMIIDDQFLRVASSNLNNRSMGLDAECDLAIEASPENGCHQAIREVRQKLIAEHLGVGAEKVQHAEESQASLIAAIESLRGGEKTFHTIDQKISAELNEIVPDSFMIDPEKPVEPDELVQYLFSYDKPKKIFQHWFKTGVFLLALIALAIVWNWAPASEFLDPEYLRAVAKKLDQHSYTPVLVVGVYVIAGFIGIPVSLLILVTVTVFGFWKGVIYSLVGAEISALAVFATGYWLGKDMVKNLIGSRTNRLSRVVAKRGIITVVTLRVLPIAPFSVINVIAGISMIRWQDFAIGNLIGLLPGVLATAFLTERVIASIHHPDLPSILWLVVAVLVITLSLFKLRQWIRRRNLRRENEAANE